MLLTFRHSKGSHVIKYRGVGQYVGIDNGALVTAEVSHEGTGR